MKKFLACFISILIFPNIRAQDTIAPKVKEIYFSVASLNPANVQIKYKTQIGKKTLLKFSLVDLSYRVNHSSYSGNYVSLINTNYSGGMEAGIEFRRHLFKDFSFYHGPNLGFTSNLTQNKNKDYQGRTTTAYYATYTAYIPYSVGVIMKVVKHLYFSAEINPSVSYTVNNNNGNNVFGAGFSNKFCLLSVVYRL